MKLEDVTTVVVGAISTNCYLFGNDTEVCAVDPGGDADLILDAAKGKTITHVLLTHSHYDHILAINELIDKYPEIVVGVHISEHHCPENPDCNLSSLVGEPFALNTTPELLLEDGMVFEIAGHKIEVIHTPGHTVGGCSFLSGEILFSGDTLFHSSVGRTDLPGGDGEILKQSVRKLYELPGRTVVFPGHMQSTKISWERHHNPYVQIEIL
ncbi:MBL fold metallo-hydrolase [bacterium]|nr:MBL fold metallo-hydrolase [bacterium]